MRSPRRTAVFCLCLALGVLGSSRASGQLVQGTDYGSILMTNPANWTSTILDPDLEKTVVFKLNPCEYALYWDSTGAARTCLARAGICSKVPEMVAKLEDAMEVWGNLDPDGISFSYGGLVGGSCPVLSNQCPETDGWQDDDEWVLTRTYLPESSEFLANCTDATTPMLAGGGLRFYNDEPNDHGTRTIRECDIVFGELALDTAPEHECVESGLYTQVECEEATTMALAHEVAHCVGFGHSYLSRRSLELLGDFFDGEELDLLAGLPSIMSYDRPGSVDIGQNGLNLVDIGLYLATYATPDPGRFAAFGTVVGDTDCSTPTGQVPLFGAAVVALEATATTVKPVHLSMTGLDSGVDPPSAGEFRLEHLDRNKDYRLIVLDARDSNQMQVNGWDWGDTESATPKLPVFRTDLWDEAHSGNAYKYETSAQFATGFDLELTAEFPGPGSGDHDAGTICVEF